MRDRVAQLPPESLASQWSKELLQMLARPSSYEHHEIHGEWMTAYAQLLQTQSAKPKPTTQEDIEAAFATARNKRKINPLRDMANQSKWKDNEPTAEELSRLSAELPTDIEDVSGIRTIPSKEITKADRSERPGEDHDLVARVQANTSSQDGPDELKEIMVDLEVGEKRAARKQWEEIVEDVDELFNDD
mgnify:CR=1 FL=1|jgi:hypothetical protein